MNHPPHQHILSPLKFEVQADCSYSCPSANQIHCLLKTWLFGGGGGGPLQLHTILMLSHPLIHAGTPAEAIESPSAVANENIITAVSIS